MSEQNEQDTAFQNLLARHNNDAEAAARELFAQNYRLREQRRVLESTNASLEARVHDDDSVVIPREENELFQQLRELGTLEEIQQQLTDGQAAIRQRDSLQRRESVRTMLPRDYHAEAVLELLAEDAQLVQEGENIVIQQGDTKTPLDEWVTTVTKQKPWISLRAEDEDTRPTFTRQPPLGKSGKGKESLLTDQAGRMYGGKQRGKGSHQ